MKHSVLNMYLDSSAYPGVFSSKAAVDYIDKSLNTGIVTQYDNFNITAFPQIIIQICHNLNALKSMHVP